MALHVCHIMIPCRSRPCRRDLPVWRRRVAYRDEGTLFGGSGRRSRVGSQVSQTRRDETRRDETRVIKQRFTSMNIRFLFITFGTVTDNVLHIVMQGWQFLPTSG